MKTLPSSEATGLLSPSSVEYVPPSFGFFFVLKNWIIRFVNRVGFAIPFLSPGFNKFYQNKAAKAGKNRPYALSCKDDYTSYDSLTDYTYYGRHLSPADKTYTESLPDLSKVVEIFRRPGKGVETLCPKSTMLFPTFAQHLIDSFIITEHKTEADGSVVFDWARTQSPQDISIAPLYGRTVEQTSALRLKSNKQGKKGRLKSQMINGEEWAPFLWKADGTFTDNEFKVLDTPQGLEHVLKYVAGHDDDKVREYRTQIFAFGGARTNTTPQIAALNTLYLREHNRVAGHLEKASPEWDDTRVFETTRNIVIVIYLKLVIEEYINHITSLGVKFKVDPGDWMWNAPWYKRNWMSIEFSVLYRWHALVPNTQNVGGKPVDIAHSVFHNSLILEENDGDLRRTFVEISSNRATTMQCFNTADLMLEREKAALRAGRGVHMRPFADYLEYLGQDRPKSFADISSNPEVQKSLKLLYGSPERVEFYVGLLASDLPPKYILSAPLTAFVANDAFNQALTNPLLSEQVFNAEAGPRTFGTWGWGLVKEDHSIKKLVERNTRGGQPMADGEFIGMTLPSWKLF